MTLDDFPKHDCALYLEHNPNRSFYETVEKYATERFETSCIDWISTEEKALAIQHNDVWILQWYPITPIGSYSLAAYNLDALLKAAKEVHHDTR